MDSFELNKILGAVLFTCLVLLSLNITADAIFTPEKPAKPGFDIAVTEPEGQQPGGGPAPTEEPIENLLAKATVERGEIASKKCASCHTFDKGGRNLTGPNLWGIVGRERASHAGFSYSAAMKGKPGPWTIDDLNKFIQNPKGFVPGTNMTFTGLNRGTERADLLAFLNSRADNPQPLPVAKQ